MFNLGFLWLALSIGSEITGTSMIKKTNGFSKLAPSVLVVCAYGLCYFALTRAMSTIPVGV
ncbi:QacE family quaternary ammonium compound efflux SMR transporter, partial [Klebsiella aerogenes]